MKHAVLLAVIAAVALGPPVAHAGQMEVAAGQEVYHYGDRLSFTVTVPAAVHDTATFRIIDGDGMGSSQVRMAITGESTVLTAPNPFLPSQFGAGTYTIEVQYGTDVASTEFQLEDSGEVIIPFWIKDVAGLWTERVISDTGFFKNMVDNDIIVIGGTLDEGASVAIPPWYRVNAEWWRAGSISDGEFARGLQYLVSINAVTIRG